MLAVAAGVASIGLWTGSGQGLQATACAHLGALTWIQKHICDLPYQDIGVSEADVAVSQYLGRSSNAVPDNGWRMLSPAAQSQYPLEVFRTAWKDTGISERVGHVDPVSGAFNTYKVTYRSRRLVGKLDVTQEVRTWKATVKLAYDAAKQVRFDLVGIPQLSEIRQAEAPPVTVSRDTAELLNSPVVGFGSLAGKVGRGQQLRVLCNLEVPNHGWWARTEAGFVDNRDLGLNGPVSRAEPCDRHYADDVANEAAMR